MDELYTYKDIEKRTGLGSRAIQLKVKKQTFPKPVHKQHRYVRWLKSEVEQWVKGKHPTCQTTGA